MKRAYAAIVVAMLALACGDSTSPQDAFTGFWLLVTVDGVNVPTVVSGNPTYPAYPMATDTMLMDATGFYDDEPIPSSGQRIGQQGNWAYKGDSVFFFESSVGALSARAQVTGTSLTMRTLATHIFPNHNFVYTKIG